MALSTVVVVINARLLNVEREDEREQEAKRPGRQADAKPK